MKAGESEGSGGSIDAWDMMAVKNVSIYIIYIYIYIYR